MADEAQFDGQAIRDHLDEHGYAVVENVVSPEFCDARIKEIQEWLQMFGPDGFPENKRGIVHSYSVGHLSPVWRTRLAAKPVYAALWETDKLLSSIDGVAIGRPPEQGKTHFHEPDEMWLHHDQSPLKEGRHAVQGALYLEATEEDDWCLRVLDGSHKHFEEFAADITWPGKGGLEFRSLKKDEVEFFTKHKGCKLIRVPAKKGSMILWDSRTVHDNAPPIRGRQNPKRWRYVCFICMGPAKWATKKDLELKKEAYESLSNTAHWPSRDVYIFKKSRLDPEYDLKELPEVAKQDEVKKLMGVVSYDFDDGNPNGPPLPVYKQLKDGDLKTIDDHGADDFYGN